MKFSLAAPSCVIADRVGPNCRVLSELVGEVALMLLETEGCLVYDSQDLPADLAAAGLRFHAHLPVDLPWDKGTDAVLAKLKGLEQKIAFLQPRGYVLHPPAPGDLEVLLQVRPDLAAVLCLENTAHSDLAEVWDLIAASNLGVCLDLGHLLSYGQEGILGYHGLFERIRVMHVYGGESVHGHAGLHALPDPLLLRGILEQIRQDCVLVVEIFHLDEFRSSLDLLRSWLDAWGFDHD